MRKPKFIARIGVSVSALVLSACGAVASSASAPPAELTIPAEQMTVIRQVIGAVNGRDVASLRSAFTAAGVLEFPSVDSRSGHEGEVFMSDWSLHLESFPESWMGGLDEWGLVVELGSCRTRALSTTVSCAVATRWHALKVEMGEEWTFDFEGAQVRYLRMARVDLEPTNRALPLGLSDLDRWEAWLRVTHPEQADDLLPTGPDIFGHMYFRFGLDASPDDIRASIREYIATRP